MTPRDLFDVAVRTLGAFVVVWGLWDLVNAALFYTDYFRNPDMTFRFYLIFGWASIFIGLLLIRAGGVLVNFAYGVEAIDTNINPEATDGDLVNGE